MASGWLRGLVGFCKNSMNYHSDSCGCGASVNRYSRYARSSERRQMGIRFSLWRIQITVKLSVQRGSRRKKLSRR